MNGIVFEKADCAKHTLGQRLGQTKGGSLAEGDHTADWPTAGEAIRFERCARRSVFSPLVSSFHPRVRWLQRLQRRKILPGSARMA